MTPDVMLKYIYKSATKIIIKLDHKRLIQTVARYFMEKVRMKDKFDVLNKTTNRKDKDFN